MIVRTSASRRFSSCVALVALVLALLAPLIPIGVAPVLAQPGNPCIVTNTSDSIDELAESSLRAAVLSDNPVCTTITFEITDPGPVSIQLADQIEIDRNVTIQGPNGNDEPVIILGGKNANESFGVFRIGAGSNAAVTLDDLTIADGMDFNGGGIFVGEFGNVTLIDSTVRGNIANYGGGLRVYRGELTVISSTISGNSAINWDDEYEGFGGGLFNEHGTVEIINSTLSDNKAPQGGAINSFDWAAGAPDGSLTILASTIIDNHADIGSSAILQEGYHEATDHPVSMHATILDGECVRDPGLTFTGSFNLLTDESCEPAGDDNQTVGNLMLGSLQDNGGPTWTHLPQLLSPAVDSGLCIAQATRDQRGIQRAFGAECDIGAVELRYQTLTLPENQTLVADGVAGTSYSFTASAGGVAVSCTLAPELVPPTGTINSFPATIIFPVGTTSVDCTTNRTSTDELDFDLEGSFTVTTIGIPPAPTMSQPANILETTASPNGLAVDYPIPTANSPVDGELDVYCGPLAPGEMFPLGTTTITCVSAPDSSDRTIARSFTVTIVPAANLAPTISGPLGSTIVTSKPAGTAVTFVPNVSSQIDDNPTVVCTPPSGTFFSIGTHTITCTVTDKYGLSNSMSFQLTIVFDDGSSPTPPTPPTPPVDPDPEEPGEPTEPEEPQEPEEPGVPDTTAFDDVWARTDLPVANGDVNRTWVWGPAPFSTLQEVPTELWEDYAESPDGKRLVRYYDKARMEITDPNAPNSDWFVTNGLLVVELITGQMQVGDNEFIDRTPADVVIAGDLDDPNSPTYADLAGLLDPLESRVGETITDRLDGEGSPDWDVTYAYFDEVTGHNIAAPFWEFMNSSGLVWVDGNLTEDLLFENPFYGTGRPITEAYWVTVNVGGTSHDVLLQCFERRCLTYTPENDSGWQVEAGNVGLHYFIWRYGE